MNFVCMSVSEQFSKTFYPENLKTYLIDSCSLCNNKRLEDMAAVPQSAFAAKKIRENEAKLHFHQNMDLTTTNYSSKYMKSVWGDYNRYAVHNLKKIMDVPVFNQNLGKHNEMPAKRPAVENPIFTANVGSQLSFNTNAM